MGGRLHAGGVSLTALLAAYLLALQGRTRKIAELVNEKTATLKESEERYRTITETAQDAVITADAEDNIWLWNSAAEKIFGFAASEGLAGFRRTGHGPAVGKTTELTALRKDGTEFPIEVSISAYQDREGFVAVALVRDITDRKQAEEALQDAHDELETRVEERTKELARSNEELHRAKEAADAANQAKSEFLATMSHEIRTPLHGILSFARFGVDTALTAEPDKLLDYFQKIDTCGKRLMILLSDVLDLAKMESGNMQFQFKPTDIRTVLRSALNDFSSLLAERDITIDYTEPDCEVLLALDQNRLAQVIGNVLSNAGKYTPQGGTIRVDVNRSDEGVRVSIRDNGVGITEEELATIFDKFVQSSKTDSRAGGTGLGLSICREIVEAHQGRIWAENYPEGGAIFHVLLPLMMDTGPGGEQAERSCAEKTDLEDAAQTMTVEAS